MSSSHLRNKVFICYSHRDSTWLEKLQDHLRFLDNQGLIDLWDDTKICVGAKWREEIEKAIESAKIAVLLISKHFLSSDFIQNEELPPLLAAAKTDGASIFPVIISPCLFDKSILSQFQAINSPSRTLQEMDDDGKRGEWDRVLVKLATSIQDTLSNP